MSFSLQDTEYLGRIAKALEKIADQLEKESSNVKA